MRLVQDRLELTADERALLALACADDQVPALEVEAFVEWLVDPLSEHALALRHGARIALAQNLCQAFALTGSDCESGVVWAVTRHPGALAWLHSAGVRPHRVVAHLDLQCLNPGDTVIGIVPLSLAVKLNDRGVRCVHVTMDMQMHDRGRELSPARMRECGARLEVFEVRRIPLPTHELRIASQGC